MATSMCNEIEDKEEDVEGVMNVKIGHRMRSITDGTRKVISVSFLPISIKLLGDQVFVM